MSITVTVTADDTAGLVRQLTDVLEAFGTVTAAFEEPQDAVEAATVAKDVAIEIKPSRGKPGRKAAIQKEPVHAPPEPEYTEADLRKVLTEFLRIFDDTKTRNLLKEIGHADRVSSVPPERYAAVIDAANAMMAS